MTTPQTFTQLQDNSFPRPTSVLVPSDGFPIYMSRSQKYPVIESALAQTLNPRFTGFIGMNYFIDDLPSGTYTCDCTWVYKSSLQVFEHCTYKELCIQTSAHINFMCTLLTTVTSHMYYVYAPYYTLTCNCVLNYVYVHAHTVCIVHIVRIHISH